MKIIKDRYDYIKEYCRGKTVLDLGAIGNNFEIHSERTPWLHLIIKNAAKELIGLDNDKEKIKKAEKISGTQIIYGDVSNFDLGKKFDVILAGELIEHLENFRGFFESVKKHMNSDSLFIITTPNCFSFDNLIRALLFGKTKHHPGHIVYFDLGTLSELLEKNGFKIIKYYYGTEKEKTIVKITILRVLGFLRKIFNKDLMVVAQLK